MASYDVFVVRSARKELADVPAQDRDGIVARIAALADDTRPPGGEKLSLQDKYRVRQGDYRIVYTVVDATVTVWVVKGGHRRDVYRRS
jgi:mRNA interferase RelE/StbE